MLPGRRSRAGIITSDLISRHCIRRRSLGIRRIVGLAAGRVGGPGRRLSLSYGLRAFFVLPAIITVERTIKHSGRTLRPAPFPNREKSTAEQIRFRSLYRV